MDIPGLGATFGLAILPAAIIYLVGLGRASSRTLRPALVIAIASIVVWTTLVGGLAVAQHRAFHTHAYDLAIFDQVLWNSAQGRLFLNSVMADSPSFLGHHFSPLLLALVPVYWVYPDPVALLVVQAALLGLAGLPLFLFARARLGSGLALAVLAAYLLHPATAHVALFDFHEIVLAVPLLAFALFFLLRGRLVAFVAVSAVAALAKEDVGLIVAAMGLFLALAQRRRIAGLAIAASGLLWTIALVRFVIPSFHPTGQYFFSALFSDLGASPLGIAETMLRNPGAMLSRMVAPSKLLYLQQLLAPLVVLPLLGWPVLAIALPSMLYLLLGGFPGDLIQYQYSAPLLAPLLFASVAGLAALRDRLKPYWPALVPSLMALVVAAAAVGAYLYGPLPLARGFRPDRYVAAQRLAVARDLMARLPPQASVIAQSDLVPQLSRRATVQAFGLADPELRPDFYLFDTDSGASRYPLGYEDQPYFAAVARVASDAEYRVEANQDGYLLLRRVEPKWDKASSAVFGDQIELVGYTIADGRAKPGGEIALELYWRAARQPDANYSVFIHLLDESGTARGQRDSYPVGELYPTSQWEMGRLLRGEYAIPISDAAPAGSYRLEVGLYNLRTMQRLARTTGEPAGDSITISGVGLRR